METKEIVELVSQFTDFAMSMKELKDAAKKDDLVPNPHFVANGITGSTDATAKNLFKRKLKKIAGVVFSAVGAVGAKFGSIVNVPDLAKHGAAMASTSVHLYQFVAMAEKVRDGGSLRRQLNLLIKLKGVKLGARGVQAGAACAGAFAEIPGLNFVGTAAALAHEHVFLRLMKTAILRTALDLHWRAYRELVLLRGSTTESGPALRIVRQLLTLSVATAVGADVLDVGQLHSVAGLNEILREPAGYLVILYKLEQT